MEIIQLYVIELFAYGISELRIVSHGSFKHVEIDNSSAPYVIFDIIIDVGYVSDIGLSLLFGPFFIDCLG